MAEGSDVGAWVTYAMYRGLGTAMQKLPEVAAAAAAVGRGASALSHLGRKVGAMYGRHLRRVLGPDLSEPRQRADHAAAPF